MSMTTQDMVALRKARALIEDVAPRTAFGRSVNYIDNRWDNGKCLLGVYEASENWDKATTDQYVADACYYLNNLNEHFKVPGYHFDLTGITEGNLYVAKDREETDWVFNSCDGEYDYMQENAYRQYLANKAEVQHKLSLMVHEATIIVDEESDYASKLGQLMSIQEGVTDSISDAWTKFKNFLGKMWAKFSEFITRTINSDKNYLNKYKDIILNKEFQLDGIEVDGDYKTGIERISTFTINTPDAALINKIPTENNEQNIKQVQTIIFPNFGNSNIEFSDYCKNYFKGSKDGKENRFPMTNANTNMKDLFNYCMNYEKIRNTLNKNYGLMQKAGDSFINLAKELDTKTGGQGTNIGSSANQQIDKGASDAANAKVRSAQQPPKAGAKPAQVSGDTPGQIIIKITDENGKSTTTNYNATGLGPKATKDLASRIDATKPVNQGTVDQIINTMKSEYSSANPPRNINESIDTITPYLNLVLEAVTNTNKSNAGGTTGSKNGFKPTSGVYGNAANGIGNVNQKVGVNTYDSSGNVTSSVSKDDMAEEGKILTVKVNMYTSACSTLFAAMLSAAQTIQKDYMNIIKQHVQSYLGDKETPDTTGQAATNYAGQNVPELTEDQIGQLRVIAGEITKEQQGGKDQNKINQFLNRASAITNNARSFSNPAEIEAYANEADKALQAKQNQGQK